MDSIDGNGDSIAEDRKAGRVRRFEDLVAWQKARALTRRVYEVTGEVPFNKDLALKTQAQKASVSIMANIAEGFDRRGPSEFSHFLGYAKGSCAELRSHLYVAFDCGYLKIETLNELMPMAEEVSKVLFYLIASTNRSKITGKAR